MVNKINNKIMSSPEGYNPELPENINARNEAHDVNQMVDKDLLSRQEAGEFAFSETPKTLPRQSCPDMPSDPGFP